IFECRHRQLHAPAMFKLCAMLRWEVSERSLELIETSSLRIRGDPILSIIIICRAGIASAEERIEVVIGDDEIAFAVSQHIWLARHRLHALVLFTGKSGDKGSIGLLQLLLIRDLAILLLVARYEPRNVRPVRALGLDCPRLRLRLASLHPVSRAGIHFLHDDCAATAVLHIFAELLRVVSEHA